MRLTDLAGLSAFFLSANKNRVQTRKTAGLGSRPFAMLFAWNKPLKKGEGYIILKIQLRRLCGFRDKINIVYEPAGARVIYMFFAKETLPLPIFFAVKRGGPSRRCHIVPSSMPGQSRKRNRRTAIADAFICCENYILHDSCKRAGVPAQSLGKRHRHARCILRTAGRRRIVLMRKWSLSITVQYRKKKY